MNLETEKAGMADVATFAPTDDRAKRLMAMGQMAASLAHEIRNPLGSMELFCSLLKKDLETQPASLTLAEQIHLGIRTLDRIISNCLQFAREVVPQRKQLADVTVLLNQVLDYVRPKATNTGVAVSLTCLGEGAVSVDGFQLNQALLNFMLNAIEAAEQRSRQDISGVTPTVELISDLTDLDCWKLTIADNGVGIPAKDQAQMFDPFFTTKRGGTGLGLAISHSIITAHQGSINVKSAVGEGTTVTVLLPRQDLSQ